MTVAEARAWFSKLPKRYDNCPVVIPMIRQDEFHHASFFQPEPVLVSGGKGQPIDSICIGFDYRPIRCFNRVQKPKREATLT